MTSGCQFWVLKKEKAMTVKDLSQIYTVSMRIGTHTELTYRVGSSDFVNSIHSSEVICFLVTLTSDYAYLQVPLGVAVPLSLGLPSGAMV